MLSASVTVRGRDQLRAVIRP